MKAFPINAPTPIQGPIHGNQLGCLETKIHRVR